MNIEEYDSIKSCTDDNLFLKAQCFADILPETSKCEDIFPNIIIDRKELAFLAEELNVIVSSTGHGKTTFLINALINSAIKYPERSFHYFTFESSKNFVYRKTLNAIIDNKLSSDNRRIIKTYFSNMNLSEDNSISQETIDEIERGCRLLDDNYIKTKRLFMNEINEDFNGFKRILKYIKNNSEKPLGGIFIDHLQRISLNNNDKPRYEQLKEICEGLKDLAMDFKIPFMLTAQFNRAVNNPYEMVLNNIGEAGDIERYAGLVLGLWNGNVSPQCSAKPSVKTRFKFLEKLDQGNYFDYYTGKREGYIYLSIMKNRYGAVDKSTWLETDFNKDKIYFESSDEDFLTEYFRVGNRLIKRSDLK